MRDVRYKINTMCLGKRNNSVLDKHAKIFVPYTAESEYQIDFRSKNKDKPWGLATYYHPTQFKNPKQ